MDMYYVVKFHQTVITMNNEGVASFRKQKEISQCAIIEIVHNSYNLLIYLYVNI